MADMKELPSPCIKIEQIDLNLLEDGPGFDGSSYARPSPQEETTDGHVNELYMDITNIPTENTNSSPGATSDFTVRQATSQVNEHIFGEWKSTRTWKLVSEKTESEYAEATRLARLQSCTTCPLCDVKRHKHFMRARIHIRQHFTMFACICGMASRSRDTISEHQRSRACKDSLAEHGGEGKFIYEADETGYSTLRLTIIPKLPESFPGCLPRTKMLPSQRNTLKRRKRKFLSDHHINSASYLGQTNESNPDQPEQLAQVPILKSHQLTKSVQVLRDNYDCKRKDLERITYVLSLLNEDLSSTGDKTKHPISTTVLNQSDATANLPQPVSEKCQERTKNVERIEHLCSLLTTDLTNIGLRLAEAELHALQKSGLDEQSNSHE